jgi:hypothetical protein
MDGENPQNGSGNGKVYVKFGKLPTQEMPREWAEEMLTMWREANPAQFGKMLAKVVTGGKQ